jgi:transcriptional regulator with XRE-family HTH domain
MDATASGDRFRGLILLLRGRAGLTQRALAAHLGTSEQAIRKWETGEGYPTPTRLQALIALYLERGVFTAGRSRPPAGPSRRVHRAAGAGPVAGLGRGARSRGFPGAAGGGRDAQPLAGG